MPGPEAHMCSPGQNRLLQLEQSERGAPRKVLLAEKQGEGSRQVALWLWFSV